MRNKASTYRSVYLRAAQAADHQIHGISRAYSPPWISEPWRRALRKSARNIANDAIKSTALIASAEIIRSTRNTCSINSVRMPSNTYVGGSVQATYCSQCGSTDTG